MSDSDSEWLTQESVSEDTDSSFRSYSDDDHDDNSGLKHAGDQCPSPSEKLRPGSSKVHAFINYVSDPPSLKSIALAAVAVKVWGYPDNCKNDYDSDSDDDYPNIEEEALKTLKEICLPESLKRQVSNILRPIGIQWVGWVEYADGENFTQYCNLDELYREGASSYWTMDGIVNVVRLVKDITNRAKELRNKKVNFSTLYHSSCMYCLEECISDLWLKLPDKKRHTDYYTRQYHKHIIAYWTASLNNELPDLMRKLKRKDRDNIYNINLSVSVNLISSFIVSGNVIALSYFWKHKLTEQEKNSNIQNWIRLVMRTFKAEYFDSDDEDFDLQYDETFGPLFDFFRFDDDDNFTYQSYNALTSIMCFLLSHLNSQVEQREIFETYSKVILQSLFFHWPLQRFFLPTITVMLDFLQENIYVGIMIKIAHLISKRRTEVLFREVWDISPLNLKKAFLRYLVCRVKAITQLLIVGDEITIDKVLNNATAEQKKLILFRLLNEPEFYDFVYSNKLAVSVMDRLASKTLSSDCDLHLFKQNFMLKHGVDTSTDLILSGDLLILDELLNWASQSFTETGKLKQDYIDPIHIYRVLITLGNYERLNEFLNWYFETDKDILKFKKSFVHKDNFKECKVLLEDLRMKKSGWKLFEKFLKYSFDSSDEISQFKRVFVEFVEKDESFTGYKKEFNTLFKNWYLSPSDKDD